MTSDNQPTQSFDEKLMYLANDLINAFPGYTGIDGDLSGRMAYLVKTRTATITAIKAAIHDSRPVNQLRVNNDGLIHHGAPEGYNAALDEWSKNMGVE